MHSRQVDLRAVCSCHNLHLMFFCLCLFLLSLFFFFFFFNDTATTEIYTLSLHDALPICPRCDSAPCRHTATVPSSPGDRKSTRLNSSHLVISYAVFCLKKKKSQLRRASDARPSHRIFPRVGARSDPIVASPRRPQCNRSLFFFFFNDTATTEIYTLSLHDALPI